MSREREEIERRAGRGLFGADAAGYDRARPDYPERVYEILAERGALRPGARVLEVGPGTGIATRRLAKLGAASIVAIEPDERFADHLRAVRCPDGFGVVVRVEGFEEARLEERHFDLAVAATSFHWIDQGPGLRKVARSLRPGGCWAMWWTVYGDPSRPDPFHRATASLIEGLLLGPSHSRHSRAGGLPFALDVDARIRDLEAVPGFERVEHEAVRWSVELSPAEVRGLYGTFSTVTALEASEQVRILDAIERVALEEFAGRVERHFVTPIYTASARADSGGPL